VLFLCTANACRSQMAEGLLRAHAGDRYEVSSAGWRPTGRVHPLAVQVMAEAGVDISGHGTKGLDAIFQGADRPDVVITLCEQADRQCPVLPPGTARIRWPVLDPIVAQGNEEIQLSVFRGVRDEIRRLIEEALESGEIDRPPQAPERRRSWLQRLLGR
jgi:arsenate reductase (thioredoxin)